MSAAAQPGCRSSHDPEEDPAWVGGAEDVRRVAALVSGGELALTYTGAEVLAGRADRVALNGFDRWLGGVHVQAGDSLWRWDAERHALVEP